MRFRTTLANLIVLTTTVSTVALAWFHEADDATAQAERSGTTALKLGEELPPPRAEEDKATTILVEMMKKGVKQFPEGRGFYQRDQHPKHHGCVRAKFVVAGGIPDLLKVGIFREARAYDAVIRFSNGGSQDDNVPDAHGMAIKVLGVEGPGLLEGEGGTQDFIMIDHDVFFAIDPSNLLAFLAANSANGEAQKSGNKVRIETATKVLVNRFSKQLDILKETKTLGTPSPFQMTFHSQVPYRLGKNAIKFSAKPGTGNESGRGDLTKDSSKNALREAMAEQLVTKKKAATFEFRVQVQTDPVTMPAEDPTVRWDDMASKPITVAIITIPPQTFDDVAQMDFCEHLSFTPWHSLEEHRPIGGINRARKSIYEATSKLRHEQNKHERKEPTIADLDRLFKLDPSQTSSSPK